jgi:hypothetical protein
MRTWQLAGLLAISLLLFTAMPSDAGTWQDGGGRWHGGGFGHGHHHFHGGGARFFVGVGPVWPAPWWYYPPPLYTYSAPPVIVESPPPVVVQPAPVAPPPAQYWYFCQSFNAYYPETPTCPEPWLRVPARPY